MRITKYAMELDRERNNILVKESCKNYPDVDCMDSPKKIVNMMNNIFNAANQSEEHLWMVAMKAKNRVVGVFEISHGTISESCFSPREIFIRLCLCGATNFIVVHNHPSGDTTPSETDIDATKRIKYAGDIMGIPLLDHIIIGNDYRSVMDYI